MPANNEPSIAVSYSGCSNINSFVSIFYVAVLALHKTIAAAPSLGEQSIMSSADHIPLENSALPANLFLLIHGIRVIRTMLTVFHQQLSQFSQWLSHTAPCAGVPLWQKAKGVRFCPVVSIQEGKYPADKPMGHFINT